MKVRDLREALAAHDPDADIVVESCDGCLVEPTHVERVTHLLAEPDAAVGLIGGYRG